MRNSFILCLFVRLLILNIVACGEKVTVPEHAGFGAHPTLPPPNPTLLPTVAMAPARGWPQGATPGAAAAGLLVSALRFDHHRWLYVFPNGDVLVAETNAPPEPRRQQRH
jgi:glucose/arabinose dehydrogenase